MGFVDGGGLWTVGGLWMGGTRLHTPSLLETGTHALKIFHHTSIVISEVICCLPIGVWVEEHHFILNDLIFQRWSAVTGEVVCINHEPEVGTEPLVQVLVARGLV